MKFSNPNRYENLGNWLWLTLAWVHVTCEHGHDWHVSVSVCINMTCEHERDVRLRAWCVTMSLMCDYEHDVWPWAWCASMSVTCVHECGMRPLAWRASMSVTCEHERKVRICVWCVSMSVTSMIVTCDMSMTCKHECDMREWAWRANMRRRASMGDMGARAWQGSMSVTCEYEHKRDVRAWTYMLRTRTCCDVSCWSPEISRVYGWELPIFFSCGMQPLLYLDYMFAVWRTIATFCRASYLVTAEFGSS